MTQTMTLYRNNQHTGRYELSFDMIADGFGQWRITNSDKAAVWPLDRLLRDYLTAPAPSGLSSTWGEVKNSSFTDGREYDALAKHILGSRFCKHCGQLMFFDRSLHNPRWRTVYRNTGNPGQCHMRDGQQVAPVGHEVTAIGS